MQSLPEAITAALRDFEGADLAVMLTRDDEPLLGFFGRLVTVAAVISRSSSRRSGGSSPVGGVTLPALAEAEWRDGERRGGDGDPPLPTERYLAIDVGNSLEVELTHRG